MEKSGVSNTSLIFSRSERLLGSQMMERMTNCRVIIFGIGGVGSWTAEALVRSGIGHITLVDADRVSPTNINRQAMATVDTVGEVKVEAMKRLLLTLNPALDIHIYNKEYNETTAGEFDLSAYDYIIDAIDSLSAKALLIRNATFHFPLSEGCPKESAPVLFSSMGAAMKIDPTKISVAEFWKVQGCPLAAALRRKFKKSGQMPLRKFRCVYSPELVANRGEADLAQGDTAMSYNKVAYNGSLCHITAIFGMTLAGLVIENMFNNK